MAVRKDLVFSMFMVALSIALAVQSFRFPADSAFFPRVLSILLLCLSALLLFRALRRPPGEAGAAGIRNIASQRKSTPILVFGSTALYVAAIPVLGFLAGTALFLFGSILFLHRRRPVLAVVYGLCFSAALYFLFHSVLKVSLPRGWLL